MYHGVLDRRPPVLSADPKAKVTPSQRRHQRIRGQKEVIDTLVVCRTEMSPSPGARLAVHIHHSRSLGQMYGCSDIV